MGLRTKSAVTTRAFKPTIDHLCTNHRGIELVDGNLRGVGNHTHRLEPFLKLVESGVIDTTALDYVLLHGDFSEAAIDSMLTMVNEFVLLLGQRGRIEHLAKTRRDVVVLDRGLTVALARIETDAPPFDPATPRFTTQQFFMFEVQAGIHAGNEAYVQLHRETARSMVAETSPETAIELGAGVGTTLESMLDLGIRCTGYDISELHRDYFNMRTPWYAKHYHVADFCSVELPEADLYYSIEVFEHIPDDALLPLVAKLGSKCRWFVFSSTPHRTTERFDHVWGHINLKSEQEWIEFFGQGGLTFEKNLSTPTEWTLLFRGQLT